MDNFLKKKTRLGMCKMWYNYTFDQIFWMYASFSTTFYISENLALASCYSFFVINSLVTSDIRQTEGRERNSVSRLQFKGSNLSFSTQVCPANIS